jgi:hypothetical protein
VLVLLVVGELRQVLHQRKPESLVTLHLATTQLWVAAQAAWVRTLTSLLIGTMRSTTSCDFLSCFRIHCILCVCPLLYSRRNINTGKDFCKGERGIWWRVRHDERLVAGLVDDCIDDGCYWYAFVLCQEILLWQEERLR